MADYPFTPVPPAMPADCVIAGALPKNPTKKWLDAYGLSKDGAGVTGPPLNGIDGLWSLEGETYVYRGWQTLRRQTEQPNFSAEIFEVPANRVWRIHALSWSVLTNALTSNVVGLVFVWNDDGDIMWFVGQHQVIANSGSQITFAPGGNGQEVLNRIITESLPERLMFQAGWKFNMNMTANQANIFLENPTVTFEEWEIAQNPGGGGNDNGGNDGGLGDGWFKLG